MRGQKIGVAVVAVVVIAALGALGVVGYLSLRELYTPNLGDYEAPANVAAQTLGEIGPGACWPKDERPSGGSAAGFASENGTTKAADWLRKPENKDAALRLERHFNAYADYYLVREVVPDWEQVEQVERVARYVSLTVPVKMRSKIRVLNTYCKDGNVVQWEVQVLPKEEWVSFVPGHEPGSKEPRPVQKLVCGNPLLLPPPLVSGQPDVTTTVPPGNPGCEGSGCTPTTPPPNCTYPCGKEPKDPRQDPAAQGNDGGNGGRNTDPGPGVYIPDSQMERPADTPRQNPAPPVATQPAPPPVVTPNPNPGPAPTVQPSTQPPNHGTVPTNPGAGDPCNPDFQECP